MLLTQDTTVSKYRFIGVCICDAAVCLIVLSPAMKLYILLIVYHHPIDGTPPYQIIKYEISDHRRPGDMAWFCLLLVLAVSGKSASITYQRTSYMQYYY